MQAKAGKEKEMPVSASLKGTDSVLFYGGGFQVFPADQGVRLDVQDGCASFVDEYMHAGRGASRSARKRAGSKLSITRTWMDYETASFGR